MRIRSLIAAGLTAGVVLVAQGSAFAQSGQGGYLGVNPGANVPTAGAVVARHGSGQGGYLGLNPGANRTETGSTLAQHGSGQGGYLGLNPGVHG